MIQKVFKVCYSYLLNQLDIFDQIHWFVQLESSNESTNKNLNFAPKNSNKFLLSIWKFIVDFYYSLCEWFLAEKNCVNEGEN